jgi:hypothetical protein
VHSREDKLNRRPLGGKTMNLTNTDIEKGFWYHLKEPEFPPEVISYPKEYSGGSKLCLACTQLDIKQSEQIKLRQEWCELLPTFTNLQFLWFYSRVTQDLFDAVCDNPNIVGFYTKWSGNAITDISKLEKLKKLRYLHMGSCTSLTNIDVFMKMDQLIVLEIENFKKISDISVLSGLNQLEGLGVMGDMWTTPVVDSLKPISELTNLRYLFLTALKSKDETLLPLLKLKQLESLHTSYRWPKKEFQLLRDNLPNLRFGSPLELELIDRFGKMK